MAEIYKRIQTLHNPLRFVLENGTYYSDGTTSKGYIAVADGKIVDIGPGKAPDRIFENFGISPEDRIDCSDLLLLPGFIDEHVHLRDFDQKYKETIDSGTLGALIGGTTTVMAMPNTSPPLSTPEIIKRYVLKDDSVLNVNLHIHASIRNGFNLEFLDEMSKMGIRSIKIYPQDTSEDPRLQLRWYVPIVAKWSLSLKENDFTESISRDGGKFPTVASFALARDLLAYLFRIDATANNEFGIPSVIDSPETLEFYRLRWKNELKESPDKAIKSIIKEFFKEWETLFEEAREKNISILFHPELIRSNENFREIIGSSNDLRDEMNNSLSRGKDVLGDNGGKSARVLWEHHLNHPIEGNELGLVELISILLYTFYPDPEKSPHVHFCHVSSDKVVKFIAHMLKDKGYNCTVEVTPHHLLLDTDLSIEPPALGKVLTPLRPPDVRKNLFTLLDKKTPKGHYYIDAIGTDHAPHTYKEKSAGFDRAPSGLPYIDYGPGLMLDKMFKYKIAMDTLIRLYCETPARLFGIKGKGRLNKGYDADLMAVRRVKSHNIEWNSILSKQKWCPFKDWEISSRIEFVIVNGKFGYIYGYKPQKALGKALLEINGT